MAALARVADEYGMSSQHDFGWQPVRLSGLLAATADRYPGRVAFTDQRDRRDWNGRPQIGWTYGSARAIIGRLASFLHSLKLVPRSPVGICLANSSEACLAILAVEQAGLTPCLLPIGWSEKELGQAVEAAHASVIITQGMLAEERPAEIFCRLAARYFGLRFVCAFGPCVPDGVIDLDRAILETEPVHIADGDGEPTGLVTFQMRDSVPRPIFRSNEACIAAAVTFLIAQKIDATDRIVSLLAPDDHRSLTTGLVASLVTGATLECHGLFSAAALDAALQDGATTHLVIPAWLEPHVAQANLPDSVATVVLVHEAPMRFKARTELRRNAIDALSFGELALVARAREASGHLSFSLEDVGNNAPHLLGIRRDEEGMIHFRGTAAEIYDFEKGMPKLGARQTEWRASGFKADLFAGVVIGVR